MQTLWARAAQVRSTCRCSLCASPTNALTQRVTGLPVWRRVSQADVFLVFSSTIAFEAAVYDSVRKSERSREWDRLISEGKNQIKATEEDQEKRLQTLLDNVEQRAAEDGAGKKKYPELLDWTWQGVFAWAAKHDEWRRVGGFDDWKGPSLNFLQKLTTDKLEELQSDKRLLDYFYGGPDCAHLDALPLTASISTKKLRTQEWSTAKLVLKIMWAFCGQGKPEVFTTYPTYRTMSEVSPAESSCRPKWPNFVLEAQHKLDELIWSPADSDIYDDYDRPPLPAYDDPIATYEDERVRLIYNLRGVLQEIKSQDDLKPYLTKICHHLLSSKTPPNVHLYNLLLVRFCQLEEKPLVHFVLEAMWESHIRPNEITHATALRFFKDTGNKAEFSMYVKRMRGLQGGFALADPRIRSTPLLKGLYHLRGERLHMAALKARMNHEVYSALIIGMIHFFDPEDGMYWYRAMIDRGWRPTAELLTAILRECCMRNEWAAGLATWQQFAREAVKTTSLAYEWMLRLCQGCHQLWIYHKVVNDGIREGVLPAGVLDHAHHFKSKDPKLIIEYANSQPGQEINHRLLDKHQQRQFYQMQWFQAKEGRAYLVKNSLSRAATSRVELQAGVQRHARDLSILLRLRKAIAKYETALRDISSDIALTISEINSQSPAISISPTVFNIGRSKYLNSLFSDRSPRHLRELYDDYRNSSVRQLEQVSFIDIPSNLKGDLPPLAPQEPENFSLAST